MTVSSRGPSLVSILLQGVCHRDLKLENTLLDGRPAPRLKICDFGYSKSAVFDSQPKSTVGTPAYIAPEVSIALNLDCFPERVCLHAITRPVLMPCHMPYPAGLRLSVGVILNVSFTYPEAHSIERAVVENNAHSVLMPRGDCADC